MGYGSFRSAGHKFYDSLFEGGAGYDQIRFDGSGVRDFSVGWTLTIETEPLADITIRNLASSIVWTGNSGATGIVDALLLEYLEEPGGRTYYTPHQVTVEKAPYSKTEPVTVDAKKTVQIWFNHTLTVNSGTGSGTYEETDVVPIVADAHPTGEFLEWVGDTTHLDDPNDASTSVTMPAADVEVTATYIGPYWRGDRNEDEFVGQTDLDIVLDMWGNSGGEITDQRADVNEDDFVGQTDLDYVLDDWGNSGRQPL